MTMFCCRKNKPDLEKFWFEGKMKRNMQLFKVKKSACFFFFLNFLTLLCRFTKNMDGSPNIEDETFRLQNQGNLVH